MDENDEAAAQVAKNILRNARYNEIEMELTKAIPVGTRYTDLVVVLTKMAERYARQVSIAAEGK